MKHKLRILIADDVALMRELLAGLIRRHGEHDIVMARDGQAALDLCSRPNQDFDVAFLDQDMPGFKGTELLNFIKAQQPHCVTAIVTGNSDRETVRSAIEAGVDGFLVKPYSMSQVEEILSRAHVEG
jgi:two-component system chemotaxis response regulator CheY